MVYIKLSASNVSYFTQLCEHLFGCLPHHIPPPTPPTPKKNFKGMEAGRHMPEEFCRLLCTNPVAKSLKTTLVFPASARYGEQTKEGFFYQNEWLPGE